MEVVFWVLTGALAYVAWLLISGEIRYERQMREEIELLESFHAEISR